MSITKVEFSKTLAALLIEAQEKHEYAYNSKFPDLNDYKYWQTRLYTLREFKRLYEEVDNDCSS